MLKDGKRKQKMFLQLASTVYRLPTKSKEVGIKIISKSKVCFTHPLLNFFFFHTVTKFLLYIMSKIMSGQIVKERKTRMYVY